MRWLVLFFLIFVLLGCTGLKQQVRNVADEFCSRSTPYRFALQHAFDATTFPHKVRVECGEVTTENE